MRCVIDISIAWLSFTSKCPRKQVVKIVQRARTTQMETDVPIHVAKASWTMVSRMHVSICVYLSQLCICAWRCAQDTVWIMLIMFILRVDQLIRLFVEIMECLEMLGTVPKNRLSWRTRQNVSSQFRWACKIRMTYSAVAKHRQTIYPRVSTSATPHASPTTSQQLDAMRLSFSTLLALSRLRTSQRSWGELHQRLKLVHPNLCGSLYTCLFWPPPHLAMTF
jgi:hypothetical protein